MMPYSLSVFTETEPAANWIIIIRNKHRRQNEFTISERQSSVSASDSASSLAILVDRCVVLGHHPDVVLDNSGLQVGPSLLSNLISGEDI